MHEAYRNGMLFQYDWAFPNGSFIEDGKADFEFTQLRLQLAADESYSDIANGVDDSHWPVSTPCVPFVELLSGFHPVPTGGPYNCHVVGIASLRSAMRGTIGGPLTA